eukprot:SAG31_NODE_2185_length_6243_cov_3.811035_4_plen_63_part_00
MTNSIHFSPLLFQVLVSLSQWMKRVDLCSPWVRWGQFWSNLLACMAQSLYYSATELIQTLLS